VITSTLFGVSAIVLGLVVFLYAGAVETAVANLSRARLQQLTNGRRERARALDVMIDHPSRYVVAAQVLRTLAGVTTTAFVVALALEGAARETLAVLWTAIVTFVGLTLLLAFPRGIAVRDPEGTLLTLYYPVVVTSAILGPLVVALNRIGGVAAGLFGLRGVPETMVVSTDALHTHTSAAREAGLIEESEQNMIDSIIELDKTTVREVMVPRLDVTALPASATVEEALEVISSKGYSRVPVYGSSIDEIVGVLYAKDLLRVCRPEELSRQVRTLTLRPVYVVPESKKTDELLRELRQSHVHFAVVVDEYGGTAGIVTIEDLLEEIVGEIQDEYDREEAKIVEVSQDEAIFDATVSIDDVNDALDLELQGEDVDTIGGLLSERLGKVPALGDRVEFDGVHLAVESTHGRRIRKVRVRRHGRSEGDRLTPRAS
jgi:CBS domain containing-hemolysin-like protein